ncbi:transcription factor HES-1-A-like [Haliotis asinina]|uniref:transcription factor HES-1-A-like n=1 Tax=Haliotis asinina TaxID=109174 RepID=UPI003531F537
MTESDSSGPSSPSKGDECKSSYRKSNKPLMEKRRRARINTCLGQLKTLVLQAMKKDNAQYSKLEKADILELTVKHLRNVQRHQMAAAMATSPDVITKYRAGFNECAGEVMRYLSSVPTIGDDMRTRVLSHLANCLQTLNSQPVADIAMQQTGHHGIHIQHPAYTGNACMGNPSAFQTMVKEQPSPHKQIQMNPQCVTTPVQFIPGTLPTGQVAFVLTSPSPVQAVPLYAAPSSDRKVETCVKQEVVSPSPCDKTVNRSPVPHPPSPSSAPPISPVYPHPPAQAGIRPVAEEPVWRPW